MGTGVAAIFAPTVSSVVSEHPNATAYRRAADAFRTGNQSELEALIAPDVVWHVPGDHPLAGDIRGRDALLAWLGRVRDLGFWLTEHDVFGNDEHVCALSIMGARRPEVDVETRVVSIFHYRDGQQLERWFYPEDANTWAQIFTGAAPADELLSAWLAEHPSVPGIVVAVRDPNGERVLHAGFADAEHREPITAAHCFRIASNTKTFVAAATMRLVERGRFALDRPIGGLLPDDVRELLERRYDLGEITTRMLLQHTSGIASHDTVGHDGAATPFLAAVARDPAHHWTAYEQIEFSVKRFAPAHEPGGGMRYTDTGYVVLGRLVEHVTGASLAVAVRQLCRLDELGLVNTWWERFEAPPDPEPPRARVQLGGDDWEHVDCSIDLYGGGGLVSNVADLTTWWRALFNGEIVEPTTLAMMLSPLAPSTESHGNAGLGLFRREVAGRTWWTHSGYWGSIVLHDPDSALTLTAFRNQSELRTAALEPLFAAILDQFAPPG